MTFARLFVAMLFSALLWFGAVVVLRAVLAGVWQDSEIYALLPFALAGIVTILFVALQCVLASSRDPIS